MRGSGVDKCSWAKCGEV